LVQANRTLARLKTLFSWALDEDLVDNDPTARVRRRIKENARDRALADAEVRVFWKGCDALEWPFGPFFKLLLLTAQRRDEVGGMEWSEIDLDKRFWTIPREKAKNDRTHEVHLSELAMEIINELPRMSRRRADSAGSEPSPYLFTTNGERPVSGFSKAKERLDKHMVQLLRVEFEEGGKDPTQAEIEDWILHDLRRIAATGMARLNIAPHVVDRILNHVSGTIRVVAAVYNRHAYLEERKAALEAWGLYVETLVRAAPANIVFACGGAASRKRTVERTGHGHPLLSMTNAKLIARLRGSTLTLFGSLSGGRELREPSVAAGCSGRRSGFNVAPP
jgi:integrase